MEASDAHPEQRRGQRRGRWGGGSVPGCAGVLAVLGLRGWSPAIPFLMAAPGPAGMPFMLEHQEQGISGNVKLITARTERRTGP